MTRTKHAWSRGSAWLRDILGEPWLGRVAFVAGIVLLPFALFPGSLLDGVEAVWQELGWAIRLSLIALCFGVWIAARLLRDNKRAALAVGAVSLLAPLVAVLGTATASVATDDPAPNCARPHLGLPGAVAAAWQADPGRTGHIDVFSDWFAEEPAPNWQGAAFYDDWQIDSPGMEVSNEGLLLVRGGFLTALWGDTGAPRWFADSDAVLPALTANAVVTVSDSDVMVLSEEEGTPRWISDEENVAGSPVVAGGIFVYDRWENQLHAFDLTDGRRCWSTGEEFFPLSANTGWAPAVSGRTLYAVLGDALVAFDTASGEERWRFAAPEEFSLQFGWRGVDKPARLRAPVVTDEDVYLVSPGGVLYALRAESGTLLWQATIGEPDGGPVVGRDLVYVTSDRETTPTLTAFDRAGGEVVWTRPYGGDPLLLTSGQNELVVLANAGAIRAVDPATGADLWSVPLAGEWFTRPTIAGPRLYVANDQGTVFAFIDPDETAQPPAATTSRPSASSDGRLVS